MNISPLQKRVSKLLVLSLCLFVSAGSMTACGTNDLTRFSGTIDVIPVTQLEKESTELTFDPLDGIVANDGFSNEDTTHHTLPFADKLKAEDTDLYQIQHNFTLPGEQMRQPDYYSIVLENGKIQEVIPGTWGAVISDDIAEQGLPDWISEFFQAFQASDYEGMKEFCTEEAQDFFFRESGAFWFQWARPLTVEVIAVDSASDEIGLQCLVDGVPAESSALEDRDGPYLLWLYCVVDESGQVYIDSCATQSQRIP